MKPSCATAAALPGCQYQTFVQPCCVCLLVRAGHFACRHWVQPRAIPSASSSLANWRLQLGHCFPCQCTPVHVWQFVQCVLWRWYCPVSLLLCHWSSSGQAHQLLIGHVLLVFFRLMSNFKGHLVAQAFLLIWFSPHKSSHMSVTPIAGLGLPFMITCVADYALRLEMLCCFQW